MLPFTRSIRSTTPRATLLQPPNLLTISSQPPKAAFGFFGTQKGAFVVRASGTPELVYEPVVNEPNIVCQPKVWYDAPIIEEYETDSEDEHVSLPKEKQETPSFANQQVKTPRETVKNIFTHNKNPKVDKKGMGYGFTTRACFVCGSLSHLIRDYDFHEKRMAKQAELNNRIRKKSSQREIRLIWNSVQRMNHKNQFVPSAVLTKTGTILVSTARASGTNNVSTARDQEVILKTKQNLLKTTLYYQYDLLILQQSKRSTAKKAGEHIKPHDLKTDEKPVDKEDQEFGLISTASPYGGLSFTDLTNHDQDDSKIPTLEEIYENPTDETCWNVSPVPTSRINSIHPSTLILGDPQSKVQTRSKVTKSYGAYAFVSYIQKQRRNNHKDFQHCLFACFLSQNKPKKFSKALEDESWVDAMQEELLNKKDERGVVVRNKARLVAQGHRHSGRIDYDVVLALVPGFFEAIRIFLAFALHGIHV
ncbi:hypothetical protein Tco_1428352 [Tanacetum coccineum]